MTSDNSEDIFITEETVMKKEMCFITFLKIELSEILIIALKLESLIFFLW